MTKQKKRWIWIIVSLALISAITAIVILQTNQKDEEGPATVEVERKNIVEKALAVGKIEPKSEVQIKAKVSGVVQRLFADLGDLVEAGTPLMELRPDPTPLELVQARREIDLAAIELNNIKREISRKKSLKEKGLISDQEFEDTNRRFAEAELNVTMAKERLLLIEKGKIETEDTLIETMIKAPITGYILEKNIAIGDPVVPLTSYQPGTVLMLMANMEHLLFKGTVDEIDVGKISEGMQVEIQVGAIPGKIVNGQLSKISLKAKTEENSTVFPVEISLVRTDDLMLRAGYSANANIIIQKKDSVLSIPERTVTFRNDSAFVNIPLPEGGKKEVYIQIGLSDAINIEVKSGLKKGDKVLEKEVKEII